MKKCNRRCRNNLTIFLVLCVAGLLAACGGGGEGSSVNPGDQTPPSNPQALDATIVSANRVDLTWTVAVDDAGVAGYHVYCNNAYLATTVTPVYPATGLREATSYCFSVTAYDAAGNESGHSDEVCLMTPASPGDTQAPEAPAGLAVTAVSSSQIDLSWGASTDDSGVAGYKVYRAGIFLQTVTAGTATTDLGLSPNTAYCYQVAAFDAAGNESAQSAQSCATTFAATDTEPPTTPAGLNATAASSSQIDLAWTVPRTMSRSAATKSTVTPYS